MRRNCKLISVHILLLSMIYSLTKCHIFNEFKIVGAAASMLATMLTRVSYSIHRTDSNISKLRRILVNYHRMKWKMNINPVFIMIFTMPHHVNFSKFYHLFLSLEISVYLYGYILQI